jgi:hypothetical protein
MPGKILAALVAAIALLAPIASASAQTPLYWGGNFGGYYGYGGYRYGSDYGYGGYYGTGYPLGNGIGVYNYAPGPGVYVYVPAYNGWNGGWNNW